MIRISGLISASLVFLLLCSPIVLIPGHAWAWGCCGAVCKYGCYVHWYISLRQRPR